MKGLRFVFIALLLGSATVGNAAAGMAKGASMFAIQLTSGQGDFVFLPGSVTYRNPSPELGFQGQYWFFLRDDYATTLSLGIGFFQETNGVNSSATPGQSDQKLTSNSWQLRVGGDRFADLGDRLQVYAGPGIHVWSGNSTFDPGSVKTESVLRYGVDGRIGAKVKLGSSVGLVGQVGHYWGYASVDQLGGVTKWLTSGSAGAMGFSFGF